MLSELTWKASVLVIAEASYMGVHSESLNLEVRAGRHVTLDARFCSHSSRFSHGICDNICNLFQSEMERDKRPTGEHLEGEDVGMIEIDEEPDYELDLEMVPCVAAETIELEDIEEEPDQLKGDCCLPGITVDEEENHEVEEEGRASWRPGLDVGGFVTRRQGQPRTVRLQCSLVMNLLGFSPPARRRSDESRLYQS